MKEGFESLFANYNWDAVKESIYQKSAEDVKRALQKNAPRTLEDFKALISPAAAPFLEEMAQLSRDLTLKRFGNTIQLFATMYLTNECQKICTYCGFSYDNP